MTIQVEFWTLVGFLLAFLSTMFGLAKWIFTSAEKRQMQRFSSLEQALKGAGDNWLRLERDLNELRVNLPLDYVRKDDYLRGQTTIEAKIDAVYSKLENIQLRQQMRNNS